MGLEDRLKQKGWSEAEIKHAMYHLNLAEKTKHPLVRFTESSTYWLFFLSLLVCVGAVATLVFPVLHVLPYSVSLVIAGILGSIFGMLFSHVLHDIEDLARAHHALIMVALIASALFVSGYAVKTDLLLGLSFSVVFCAHYIYRWWKR